jgi:hypothetical protein
VRAVIRRYFRTSGTVAETRIGRNAVMNTSAVRLRRRVGYRPSRTSAGRPR